MLRDGGNTLGSSIIGNLGIGSKTSFGLNQNFKSSMLRINEKEIPENINNGNNNNNADNLNSKTFSFGNNNKQEEKISQNNDNDNEQ